MSGSHFNIREHQVPGQHIRQYSGGTRNDESDVLYLSVKQYTPISNAAPGRGDVTIVATHANGYPKELFEPLWDELLQHSQTQGYRIRSIWAIDAAHQGYSGQVNEDKLGKDPSWLDFPMDVLQVINTLRKEMSHPIIGIGHSMGASGLLYLASIHPRLFTSLVIIEPVARQSLIVRRGADEKHPRPTAADLSSVRRDLWPGRDAARQAFLKSAHFRAWDPRVFDLWVEHGLRDLPTSLYPNAQSQKGLMTNERPVTLRTTKYQEVLTFVRPNLPLHEDFVASLSAEEKSRLWKLQHPNLSAEDIGDTQLYRPEPLFIFDKLPTLRPSMLYIFGDLSIFSDEKERAIKMELTGIAPSGSGGAAKGRVKEVLLKGVGHLVPMERVTDVADSSADWIGKEVRRWNEDQALLARIEDAQGDKEPFIFSEPLRAELARGLPKHRSGVKDRSTKL